MNTNILKALVCNMYILSILACLVALLGDVTTSTRVNMIITGLLMLLISLVITIVYKPFNK